MFPAIGIFDELYLIARLISADRSKISALYKSRGLDPFEVQKKV